MSAARLGVFQRAAAKLKARREQHPAIRRCSWCGREIVGISQPGRKLPPGLHLLRNVTDGMCEKCLNESERIEP